MKVLHIITGLNVGGAENMLCKLLESSGDGDSDAAVLSLMTPGPLAARLRAIDVPIYTLGMKSRLPGPVSIVRLARIVNLTMPDVLHGWMYHGNLAASAARSIVSSQPPLIWNVRHSLADPARETGRTRALLKASVAISKTPSAIVYNSAKAAEEHGNHGFSNGREIVIPNGFDFDAYRPNIKARKRLCSEFGIDANATIVGMVARLHPMKAHSVLVNAVAMARARGANLHLVMIGEGLNSPPPELAQAISGQLPAQSVTLLPARSDIADIMPGFDMLAVPSRWGEGFPNVIGEALACEVPVIATDVGDSARIVGDSGLIVEPGDEAGFADALVKMVELGPHGRAPLGSAGRERARQLYSLSGIAAQYERLYMNILNERDLHSHNPDAQEGAVGV